MGVFVVSATSLPFGRLMATLSPPFGTPSIHFFLVAPVLTPVVAPPWRVCVGTPSAFHLDCQGVTQPELLTGQLREGSAIGTVVLAPGAGPHVVCTVAASVPGSYTLEFTYRSRPLPTSIALNVTLAPVFHFEPLAPSPAQAAVTAPFTATHCRDVIFASAARVLTQSSSPPCAST